MAKWQIFQIDTVPKSKAIVLNRFLILVLEREHIEISKKSNYAIATETIGTIVLLWKSELSAIKLRLGLGC